jgi:hypothetical protein
MATQREEIAMKRKEVHRAKGRLIVTLFLLLLVVATVLFITFS